MFPTTDPPLCSSQGFARSSRTAMTASDNKQHAKSARLIRIPAPALSHSLFVLGSSACGGWASGRLPTRNARLYVFVGHVAIGTDINLDLLFQLPISAIAQFLERVGVAFSAKPSRTPCRVPKALFSKHAVAISAARSCLGRPLGLPLWPGCQRHAAIRVASSFFILTRTISFPTGQCDGHCALDRGAR